MRHSRSLRTSGFVAAAGLLALLVLGTYVSYEIADYVDDPLVDQRLKEGLTGEYYFNPYFSIYARYEHTDFFSTDEGSDFVENEVRLGVRIRH